MLYQIQGMPCRTLSQSHRNHYRHSTLFPSFRFSSSIRSTGSLLTVHQIGVASITIERLVLDKSSVLHLDLLSFQSGFVLGHELHDTVDYVSNVLRRTLWSFGVVFEEQVIDVSVELVLVVA